MRAEVADRLEIRRGPIVEPIAPVAIPVVARAGQSLTPADEVLAVCIRHRGAHVVKDWANESP